MTTTVLANLITPEQLVYDTRVRLRKLIDFKMFGMMDVVDVGPGAFVKIGRLTELSGTPDRMVTTAPASYDINSIGSEEEIAAVIHRIKNFGAQDIADIISGMGAMDEIVRQTSNYWSKWAMNYVLYVLSTQFGDAGALYASNCSDIYVDTATVGDQKFLTPASAATALALLGDNADDIAAWVMHSAVKARLEGENFTNSITNLAAYGLDGNGTLTTFMDKPVISNDHVTTAAGTHVTEYYTYGIARGALALGVQKDVNPELDRDTSNKSSYVATDVHYAPSIRGVKWNVTTQNPTDAQLQTAGNWATVYARTQDIKVICLRHNA